MIGSAVVTPKFSPLLINIEDERDWSDTVGDTATRAGLKEDQIISCKEPQGFDLKAIEAIKKAPEKVKLFISSVITALPGFPGDSFVKTIEGCKNILKEAGDKVSELYLNFNSAYCGFMTQPIGRKPDSFNQEAKPLKLEDFEAVDLTKVKKEAANYRERLNTSQQVLESGILAEIRSLLHSDPLKSKVLVQGKEDFSLNKLEQAISGSVLKPAA